MRHGERSAAARPFLKWAGGKRQLLPEIERYARTPARAYYEPFLGGGALFFHLAANGRLPGRVVLNDVNPHLIAAWRAVRDRTERLIAILRPMADEYEAADAAGRAAAYYRRREEFRAAARRGDDGPAAAALLLFLNRTCFNGLYRVNARGEFNVPHGRYASPRILDAAALRAAAAALRDAEIRCGDYREAIAGAGEGDLVYLDPPYQPLSRTASFTQYVPGGFGIEDQRLLAAAFADLNRRGAAAVLSNSAHAAVEALYGRLGTVRRVRARRAINSDGGGRAASEILVANPRAEASAA